MSKTSSQESTTMLSLGRTELNAQHSRKEESENSVQNAEDMTSGRAYRISFTAGMAARHEHLA